MCNEKKAQIPLLVENKGKKIEKGTSGCQGALTQPPRSNMDEAVAVVARSLWSVQVLKVPVPGARCRGALMQPPGSATDEGKDYQDMICLGRKGGRFSQGRRARSLSLQGLLLGSFT